MIRYIKLWCFVVLCTGMTVLYADAQKSVTLLPGSDIQAAVNAAPAGTTFLLQPGTYRMQSIKPKKGDTFSGQGYPVVLNGAQILTFQKVASGNLWVAAAKSTGGSAGKPCNPDTPLCDYPQDLFLDGVLQTPVANRNVLRSGAWYFDRANGLVYLSVNPAGRTAELSMSKVAFYGSATNVRIDHVIVEKYGAHAQSGAIGDTKSGAVSWVVDHVEVRWNHGAGVELGSGSTLSNSFIHHNGQLGVAMGGLNCTVKGNEIAWNNYAGYKPGWEAGGTKFWETTNLVVLSNFVHDNAGPGLWTDTNNVNTLYANNTVTNNLEGIKHEISYKATIRDNIVKGNGKGNAQTSWLWNAQIDLQNSSNSVVYGNTVEVPANGGNGIAIINQNRGSGIQGPWVAANNSVHDNTITYLGSHGRSGLVDDTGGNSAVNNHFYSNHYIFKTGNADSSRWNWKRSYSWKEFQGVGQESNGTCCN